MKALFADSAIRSIVTDSKQQTEQHMLRAIAMALYNIQAVMAERWEQDKAKEEENANS